LRYTFFFTVRFPPSAPPRRKTKVRHPFPVLQREQSSSFHKYTHSPFSRSPPPPPPPNIPRAPVRSPVGWYFLGGTFLGRVVSLWGSTRVPHGLFFFSLPFGTTRGSPPAKFSPGRHPPFSTTRQKLDDHGILLCPRGRVRFDRFSGGAVPCAAVWIPPTAPFLVRVLGYGFFNTWD